MAVLLGIDFGTKRTGIAHTDPLQLIASGLTTLPSKEVIPFLMDYVRDHAVEKCVVGLPKQRDNSPSEVEPHIQQFIQALQNAIPQLVIDRYDERFTSKMATQTLLMSGAKKQQRKNKALVDKISATLLLQAYLDASLQSNKRT